MSENESKVITPTKEEQEKGIKMAIRLAILEYDEIGCEARRIQLKKEGAAQKINILEEKLRDINCD